MRGHGIWALRIVKESREAEASHPASSSPVPIAASVPPAGTGEAKVRKGQVLSISITSRKRKFGDGREIISRSWRELRERFQSSGRN